MSGHDFTVDVVVAYGDIVVEVTVEGLGGYSSDVVDDTARRCVRAFSDAISHLRAHQMIDMQGEPEPETEDDADSTE